MRTASIGLSLVAVAAVFGITISARQNTPPKPAAKHDEKAMDGTKTLVVAGGCFWCVEAIYDELKGVSKVVSGYTGGSVPNPSYNAVCTGTTGHAEAVEVTYDPSVISESDLLHIFFTTHDPTTLNRQGPDSGTQYRSAIFYRDEAEKALAQEVIDHVAKEKVWPNAIVTTLEPLTVFYPAEGYHQDYFEKYEKAGDVGRMGMNAGYCRAIIEPKVRKFRAKYADKLKK